MRILQKPMWDDDDFQTYFEGHPFAIPCPFNAHVATSEVSLYRQSARNQASFLQKKSEHRLGMTCLEDRR